MRFSLRQLVLGLVLLQVAFGLRLAAAGWWDARLPAGQRFGFGDSEGYWELGRAIARGQPYQYGDYQVFRTPGYPALLAPLFWLAGDREPPVMWARAQGALFGTLAVLLVMLLAGKLFDERAAWIAGLIATFYPGQIASSVFVLSEAPFIPLMLLQLLAWIAAVRSDSWKQRLAFAALAGVLAGLATLVRPSWLLFTPFALGLAVIFSPQRKQHLLTGTVMLAALCLTMLPWWVRNYYVTGRFVPTTLQVGISLADGWNPQADGSSDLNRAATVLWPGPWNRLPIVASLERENIQYELDENGLFRVSAINWAGHNPLRAVQLAGIKFVRMWNFVPNASEFGSGKLQAVYAIAYTPVLICCLAGLWTFRARGFAYLLLFVPAIYFTLLHMIFVSSIRYQQPALIAWLVLGAGWLSLLWERYRHPRR